MVARGLEAIRKNVECLFENIFRRQKTFVFEMILTGAHDKLEAKVKIDVKLARRDNFAKIARAAKRLKKFEVKPKERLKMGDICISAEMHGDLVFLAWLAFNEAYVDELERTLRVGSGSAYLYDAYAVPEYRGLGIAPRAVEEAFNYVYERGIIRVYTCVRHNNFPSLRAVHKLGFRKIGTITFTRVFKFKSYKFEGETEEDYNKLKEIF